MTETKLSKAIDMMIYTDRMHKHLIDMCVTEIGIHRTQHRILMHLARKNKLPSQKELADHLNITPAAVTFALKKIENDGYIEKTLGTDNRFNEIKITEKGRNLVEKTKKVFSQTDTSLFEGFSDSELDAYIAFLEKLQINIKKQLNEKYTTQSLGKENLNL